jgi:hypothetical protein
MEVSGELNTLAALMSLRLPMVPIIGGLVGCRAGVGAIEMRKCFPLPVIKPSLSSLLNCLSYLDSNIDRYLSEFC